MSGLSGHDKALIAAIRLALDVTEEEFKSYESATAIEVLAWLVHRPNEETDQSERMKLIRIRRLWWHRRIKKLEQPW